MLETLARLSPTTETSYSLEYLPLEYTIADKPHSLLQGAVLEKLGEEFANPSLKGRSLPLPHRNTPIDQRPNMIIVLGNGELHSRSSSLTLHRHLPKPASRFFFVNTVNKLPNDVNHDRARRELVAAACHNGVIFEGNAIHPEKALWISTQGNFQILRGTSQEIYQEIARRAQIHYGSVPANKRYNGGLRLPWKEWKQSKIHSNTAEAAHRLGDVGVIENEVDLEKYTADKRLARLEARAFNENGIGESMRSELDPRGYMGITRSGGGKVEVDENPKKGHIIPVWAITEDGYVVPDIAHKPLLTSLRNGSVETHENGVIRLINSLALAGVIDNYQEGLRWIQQRFSQERFIPIQPKDLPLSSIVVIDHGHRHTTKVYDPNIKIGEPDFRYFPKIDFPCGSRQAAWALLSGLMQFEEFYRPEGLNKTIIMINLPGHGYVAFGKDRRALTEALINGTELQEPEWV